MKLFQQLVFQGCLTVLLCTQLVFAGRVCSSDRVVCLTVQPSSVAADKVEVTLETNSKGWVAFGMNTKKAAMAGADVAVLWTNDDGSGTVSDRFSSGYSEPSVDASQDWAMLEVPIINGDRTKFRIERRRSTGDQDDYDISNSSVYWIFAASPSKPATNEVNVPLRKHNWEWAPSEPINLLASDITIDAADKTSTMIIAHGVLMFMAWGVLMPFAAVVARYERASMHRQWFRTHVTLTSIAVLMVVIAFILIVASKNRHFNEFHNVQSLLTVITYVQVLGLLVTLAAVLLQVPLGVYIDRMYDPQRSAVPKRDKAHHWQGYALLVAAWIAVTTGLFEYGASIVVKVLWFVWMPLFLLFALWRRQRSVSTQRSEIIRDHFDLE